MVGEQEYKDEHINESAQTLAEEGESITESLNDSIDEPVEQPAEQSNSESDEQPGANLAEQPAEQPNDELGEQATEQSVEQPADQSDDKPTDESGEQLTEQPGDEPAEQSGEQSGDDSGEKPTEQSVQDSINESPDSAVGESNDKPHSAENNDQKNKNTREERQEKATQHLKLIHASFSTEIRETIAGAIDYKDGEARNLTLPEPAFEKTETIVTKAYATSALNRSIGKTAIVDQATFMIPGGGYTKGAFNFEQRLCSKSDLYPILRGLRDVYYEPNLGYYRGYLFTDHALFLPDVVFLRGNSTKKANVIVAAEPLYKRAIARHRSERECERALSDRIESILRIATVNQCETLICGAFACGRDGYDSKIVAGLFKNWIDEHPGAIGRFVFAVPPRYIREFDIAFDDPHAHNKRTRKPSSQPVQPNDSDKKQNKQETFRDVELPEGITLR